MTEHWIDYEICDGLAVIDKNNADAWVECQNPVVPEQ